MVNMLRVILATLVIFGAGAMSGYFLGKKQAAQELATAKTFRTDDRGTNAPPPWDRRRQSMMDRMQKDLALTDEQREVITTIFAASRERSKLLWQEIKEPMDAEVKRVHNEVLGVLNPEQAVIFEEISKKRHESFRNGERGPKPDNAKGDGTGSNDQCSIYSFPPVKCLL